MAAMLSPRRRLSDLATEMFSLRGQLALLSQALRAAQPGGALDQRVAAMRRKVAQLERKVRVRARMYRLDKGMSASELLGQLEELSASYAGPERRLGEHAQPEAVDVVARRGPALADEARLARQKVAQAREALRTAQVRRLELELSFALAQFDELSRSSAAHKVRDAAGLLADLQRRIDHLRASLNKATSAQTT